MDSEGAVKRARRMLGLEEQHPEPRKSPLGQEYRVGLAVWETQAGLVVCGGRGGSLRTNLFIAWATRVCSRLAGAPVTRKMETALGLSHAGGQNMPQGTRSKQTQDQALVTGRRRQRAWEKTGLLTGCREGHQL